MVATIIPYEQMRDMRERGQKQTVLETGVPLGDDAAANCEDIQETWRPDHQVQTNKRDAQPVNAGASVAQTPHNGMETYDSAWQRTSTNTTTAGFGCCVGMEHGGCNSNQDKERQWLSNLLQGGHWRAEFESGGGGRWKLSLRLISQESGREERRLASFTRLVSREILEPGSGSEFERVCPDGFVYNLEVSNGNTYIANGVLVHNCHHATSKSYQDIINWYRRNPKLKVLGVTATPDRADEQALGQIFESVAFNYELLDAINDGWLVPIEQQMVHIEGLDFSQMRTTAGDLNGADLAAVMEAEKNLQGVAGAAIEIIGNRRALVFTASVKQAETICEILNRHKANCAAWVCGKTNKDERRNIVSEFADGKIQIVCNCGCFTEGFDDPGVEVIIMARPTKSRSLYSQMVGRSDRALPGIVDGPETPELRRAAIAASAKPSCLIVDFVGNSGRHKLITSADILGGKVSSEAREVAINKASKSNKPVRMSELLAESELEIRQQQEEARLREAAKRAKVKAKVTYNAHSVDPFDRYGVTKQAASSWDRLQGRLFSEKQRQVLQKMGVNPDEISYSCGRKLIGASFAHPSEGQAKVLIKYGYSTDGIDRNQASKIIDAISANGWKRPMEEVAT